MRFLQLSRFNGPKCAPKCESLHHRAKMPQQQINTTASNAKPASSASSATNSSPHTFTSQHRLFSDDWGGRYGGRGGRGQWGGRFDDEDVEKAFRDYGKLFENLVRSFDGGFRDARYKQRGGSADQENRSSKDENAENKQTEQNNASKDLKEKKDSNDLSFRSLFTSGWNNFNLAEKGDSYLLTANIETFDPKDIKIEVKDGYLHVSGSSKEEKAFEDNGIKRSHKSEQSFHHRFHIPENSNISASKATFQNGALEILIPKENKQEDTTHIPIDFSKKE